MDEATRKTEEEKLIQAHLAKGYLVYNFSAVERAAPKCQLANKDTIIKNQSQEYKDLISQQNTGRVNKNRKSVVAYGNTYLSISEAEKCLKSHNIVPRVNKGEFAWATFAQIQEEELRRANGGQAIFLQKVVKQTGKETPNTYDHKWYKSVSATARALGISVQAVSQNLKRNIKNNVPGYSYGPDKPPSL